MSGEGATDQVYDAAGNPLIISDARGGQKLFNPANMKVPEIPEMGNEGDILQYKYWLRRLTLLLKAAGVDVVLYHVTYDPSLESHKEALSFVDPSNRSAYFAALRKAVRAKIYAALLKINNALLQSILDMDLSLPDMIKKLSATSGNNTDHSLADLLSEIMKISENLPRSYAGLVNYLQQFLKLLRRYNNAGGNLSDLKALNILIIKLSKCPLDQLNIIITVAKTEKIKDPDYSLTKFVSSLTSWASSEVDKPENRYQGENKQNPHILAFGRGSQDRSRENGKGKGRGRGKGKNNYNPNDARYHQNTYKGKYEGRGKGSQVEEKGKREKAKVKVLIMDSN